MATVAIKERALSFGEARRLLGILTTPPTTLPDRPAILIPNTGVDHRVGPNRLHVLIARALAESGFPTLRMDLSGMGDSLPPPTGRSSSSVDDQRAALDELSRLGIATRFLVIGLCSGGHDAHQLTAADTRIIGGAYMDHYAYPTPGFKRHYWMERLLDLRRVGNFLRRKFGSVGARDKRDVLGAQAEYFTSPSRERFEADITAFVARKVSLFFLYTGEFQNEYNYREQLTDGFPVLRDYPGLSLHFLPRSDHTFTRGFMREELIELLRRWVTTQIKVKSSAT